ncbi:efflux RND transporter permease subunit, partial [Hungatella effluvii]
MGLTRFVLKRPVATVMALLCLLVFGISSVFSATLEQMPDTDQPMLIVSASYSGAGPEDVDELVTQPIEDKVSTLEGVKSMSSSSSEGRSMVMLEYDYGTDMDEAYSDLTQSLDGLDRQLPDDVETSVMEMNNNAGSTMMLSISNPAKEDLYDYVDQTVVPLLEQISSVTDVEAMGGSSEYYRIELQSDEMAQYGLTMSDITSAMSSANLSYPSGDAVSGNLEFSVSTSLENDTIEALMQVPITTAGGKLVYL